MFSTRTSYLNTYCELSPMLSPCCKLVKLNNIYISGLQRKGGRGSSSSCLLKIPVYLARAN